MSKINPVSFTSAYSFGQGCVHPAEMAATLKNCGFTCLPLTDNLSSAGLVEGIKAAKEQNLVLLYGQQICCFSDFFLLYPDEESAFVWLHRLCSKILESPAEEPIDQRLIKVLINLPPAGEGRVIFSGKEEKIVFEIFQNSAWKCFFKAPQTLARIEHRRIGQLAQTFNFQFIFAPHLKICSRRDNDRLRLLRAISTQSLLDEVEPPGFSTPQSIDGGIWPTDLYPKATQINREFCLKPSWVPQTDVLHMPQVNNSKNDSEKILRQICLHHLNKKYPTIDQRIKQRFEFELKTINDLGFNDYFLLVNEITLKARELGVRVLGRGSAANSLISYILDFTQVDPIEHNLYFERFLNPFRKSPPDIDLDFSWKIRDQIYEFLKSRWGHEKVALISTHISYNGRSALRETGKALGVSNEELNYLSSLIGYQSLRKFLANPLANARFKPDLGRLEQHRKLLFMAASIEGLPAHFSIHAGGVVIAPDSLYNYTIIQPSSKVLPITQTEMRACEKLGLVKLDLLSQRALGVFADVSRFLEPEIKIPHDPVQIERDPAVTKALSQGKTLGVFYVESPGMRGLLAKMQCRTFAELVAASSIIRPGVAESGMMQEYLRRHLNPKAWKPIHPVMGEILAETYGIMVYQEDVMKVAHHIAGFSLADADVLRRAMSGKERSTNQMQLARSQFLAGAEKKSIEPRIAAEIWRQISSFCGYAFCKAHSASYAILSLQLLWVKVHHPRLFYAAVLNNRGGFYGPQAYISEAIRNGIKILPPDVNLSVEDFSLQDSALLTGLSFITDVKASTIKKIIDERSKAKFTSLEDFIYRIKPADDEWESLVCSQSLSKFGSQAHCRWSRKLFDGSGLLLNDSFKLPDQFLQKENRQTLIENELKALGFAVSGHPTEIFALPGNMVSSKHTAGQLNRKITVSGLLIAAKSVTTSKGERMKFLTLEDSDGLIETVFFPKYWKSNAISLDKAAVLSVSGLVKSDSGQIVVHGHRLKTLEKRR
ncbi:MAG: error-prone polymerase [Clostridiales bacterium]|jgi:DNA-directed DNA polymerase III PolC|nr:error-prone polymerase [Clostridiales bacterium]MDN5282396.1 error-prone polymerase [Candidatus Ozemobacter sp.]